MSVYGVEINPKLGLTVLMKTLADYPDLCGQLHPNKNSFLDPSRISAGSHKKLWWKCSVADDHEWSTEIRLRTKRKCGCPFCGKSPKYASSTNNLALSYPDIAKQWHPTKNGELTPDKVLSNTTKKVWWLCDNGHEYEHSVNQRTSRTRVCPYCSGYRIGQGNSFADKSPEAAAEWDYKKNKGKSPSEVSASTHSKYWFKCKLNHSYKAPPASRTAGHGCPKCTNSSSQPELRVYAEFKHLFPDTVHRHKMRKVEFDIFVPVLNLAIEYDGAYWHEKVSAKDKRKNYFCKINGIKLVRLRERPLKKIVDTDVIVPSRNFKKSDMDTLVKRIFFELFQIEIMDNRIKDYLACDEFLNGALFDEYRTYLPLPHSSKSLATLHPELIQCWDYGKNKPLTPEYFTSGSNRKVYWTCRKGHSYQTAIYTRVKSVGCPICYRTRGQGRNRSPTINDRRQTDIFK